jgi:hypothetical protein
MSKILKPTVTRMKLIQVLEREFGYEGLRDDKGILRLLLDSLRAVDIINSRRKKKP